jgi:HPt (histidine-containing phosphotransfer) domain-containing protein
MDEQDDRLHKLAQRFRVRLREDRDHFGVLADEISGGKIDSLPELQRLAHRLAGSAGIFGFSNLSAASQPLDDLLMAGHYDHKLIQKYLDMLIARIDEVLSAA